MNKNEIAVITCLEHGDPAKDNLEKEVIEKHAREGNNLSFFHKKTPIDEVVALFSNVPAGQPLHVGFHHSCTISKIVGTMKALREALPGRQCKFYYRKNGNEILQASMAKLICFSKLEENLQLPAAA